MSVLPLRQAYLFAAEHGLPEADHIRDLPPKTGFQYMSGARRGLFISLFEEKKLLQDFLEKCWPEGLTEAGQRMLRTHRRRYDDYLEFDRSETEEDDEDIDFESSSFAYESDLQNFIAKNLNLIESGLELYSDSGGTGIEYSIDAGRIDILAKDRDAGFVVVELKLSRGRSKALGQILYYMGWVDENLDAVKPCRGVIVAREVSTELKVACSRTPEIELFEYSLQVSLNRVET